MIGVDPTSKSWQTARARRSLALPIGIRRAACSGPCVAQPWVVRDKRWLYVLHGAAHTNWGLWIAPRGLKNQLVRKSEKCNTFHAKLTFSWLRVAKTRTPSICARPRQRESELILGGLLEGLFFKLFFALLFFGFLVLWGGFGTPWGVSKSVKIGKSWLREAIFEWIWLVLGFVFKNHRFFILFASKSVAFLVVFLCFLGGTFASIFASLAMSEDAYYTVKTNEKSIFSDFYVFNKFVSRTDFLVFLLHVFLSKSLTFF